VWLISQDIEAQLFGLNGASGTAGVMVFLPPGGLSSAPYGTLFGRPIVPNEYCAALGTVGDIILADLSQYQAIDKGGIQEAASIHVQFLYDESVLRFVYRFDGQPKWASALTAFNASSDTLSPFVLLATRS